MNTTQLPQPVLELVQSLLEARSTLDDVTISAPHVQHMMHSPDAAICLDAANKAIAAIDVALDLIKYSEG